GDPDSSRPGPPQHVAAGRRHGRGRGLAGGLRVRLSRRRAAARLRGYSAWLRGYGARFGLARGGACLGARFGLPRGGAGRGARFGSPGRAGLVVGRQGAGLARWAVLFAHLDHPPRAREPARRVGVMLSQVIRFWSMATCTTRRGLMHSADAAARFPELPPPDAGLAAYLVGRECGPLVAGWMGGRACTADVAVCVGGASLGGSGGGVEGSPSSACGRRAGSERPGFDDPGRSCVPARRWLSMGPRATRITPSTSDAMPAVWTASRPGAISILSPNTTTPSRIPASGSAAV